LIEDEEIELIIQVNGKLRDKILMPKGVSQKEVEKLAMARDKIKEFIGSHKVEKIIFIQDKLINIVI
ncbi:MAG: hypothetical protein Q8Q89_03000, partial [bacterium]|nr:hypothetical protein [bacterium]